MLARAVDLAEAPLALAEMLGDDELWSRIESIVGSDFAERDGAMLAAQWEACLE